MTIQIFSPIFYCIIFRLILNWCCIYFICCIDKVIRSGVIINWCNGKINILFNSFGSRTLMCSCEFTSNIFQWLVENLTLSLYLIYQLNYYGKFFITEIDCFYWKIMFVHITKWKWISDTADYWTWWTIYQSWWIL